MLSFKTKLKDVLAQVSQICPSDCCPYMMLIAQPMIIRALYMSSTGRLCKSLSMLQGGIRDYGILKEDV